MWRQAPAEPGHALHRGWRRSRDEAGAHQPQDGHQQGQSTRDQQPRYNLVPCHGFSLPSAAYATKCRTTPIPSQARLTRSCGRPPKCPVTAGATKPATITASARLFIAPASSLIRSLCTGVGEGATIRLSRRAPGERQGLAIGDPVPIGSTPGKARSPELRGGASRK